jgi:drug/metabolite transporter (DMT)-like permease
MKNLRIGITLVIICTFLTALGEFLFKQSSESFQWDLVSLLTNYYLIFGFLVYGLGAILLILALKFGDLSVIYPFIALNFIWVMMISFWLLGENITKLKILAIIFVFFGVILIAKGGKNDG